MSIYDIAMIIVFLGAIWFGYRKGLAWQIASLASIFLSYFVAVTFPDTITPYISAEAPFNRFAAMLILFVVTSLIVWTVFASISKSLKKAELKGFDRQAGALVGAFKGAILAMVITMFSVALLGDKARDTIHQSKTGYYVVRGINQLQGVAPPELAQFIGPYIEKFQQNIVDPNGNLPPRNPIFDNGVQQVNDQGQFGVPGGNFQNGQFQGQFGQPPQGQTTQAGFQSPAQVQPNLNQQQQFQGNYQSGTFGAATQQPQTSGGFQQGTFGGQQQQPQQQQQLRQWQPPNNQQYQNQQQQYQNRQPLQNQNSTQWQPPQNSQAQGQQNGWGTQFPNITPGDNGWPNVQFNVNSKDLLERGAGAALDAGQQWLNNQRQ